MKNLLLLAAICCMGLFSCRKDVSDTINYNQKKYALKFNISGFRQEITDFKSSKLASHSPDHDSSWHNSVVEVWYLAYNSETGLEVSQKRYPFTDPDSESDPNAIGIDFVQDSLPSGFYTIVMVAAKPQIGLNGHSSFERTGGRSPIHNPLHTAHIGATYGLDPNFAVFADVFWVKTNIYVGNEDIEQSLTLSRIVGRLDIVAEDLAGGRFIDIHYPEHYTTFEFDSGRPGGIFKHEPPEYYADHSPIVWNTGNPFDVTLTAVSAEGDTVTKVVEDVIVFPNRRTVLRGNMFDMPATNSSSFNITVDDEWDTDSLLIPF